MSTLLDQKGVIIEKENQSEITSRPLTAIIQSNTTADILRSRILDSGLTMKQAFLKFDKNGSGSIENEEMKEVLKQFHIPFTEMEIVDLFEKYDINRDNRFQYGEFVRIIQMKS